MLYRILVMKNIVSCHFKLKSSSGRVCEYPYKVVIPIVYGEPMATLSPVIMTHCHNSVSQLNIVKFRPNHIARVV